MSSPTLEEGRLMNRNDLELAEAVGFMPAGNGVILSLLIQDKLLFHPEH